MAAKKKRKTRPKKEIGKKTKPKKKKRFLRKIAKFHALFTGLVLASYLAVGFWMGPGALKKDIEGKVAGASTVLSLHIAGPPGKPVVADPTGCDGANPYIDIFWGATTDTDNYDVYRDGALLVSGQADTHYRDEGLALGTAYSYYVIANGPLGSTQSDTVTETTPGECYVPPPTPPSPPPPEDVVCRITTLNKIDLTNFRCLPIAKKKRPVFSGTANVSNAKIQAEISYSSGKQKVISSLSANENGYWSWGVQGQLKKGIKNIYVKATDPNDSSRFGTCSLRFKISSKNYGKKKMKKCTGALAYKTLFVPPSYKFSNQLELQLKSYEKPLYSGDNINIEADLNGSPAAMVLGQRVNFQVVDSKNNMIYETQNGILPDKNGKASESLKIPLGASSGQYKVIAQIAKGDDLVTVEKDIAVKEKPIIKLSSNWSLTYAQLLSSLGWIAMALTTVLLIFFGLLIFEYHLSRYAVLQVTEGKLKKDGYID